MRALDELLQLRSGPVPTEEIVRTGSDPVLPTRFALGETAADVHTAIGIAVNDLWEMATGRRQALAIDVGHAAATLRSYQYLDVGSDNTARSWARQRGRQKMSTPHPTRDGRYFLPHMGLAHLAERIRRVLDCADDPDALIAAVARWDALALEEAIAAVNGCGAMVRSEEEWLAHPQGQWLASRPVLEITRVADSPPEPLPVSARPLGRLRVLDLTRILAGPTCARTLAEHGAEVLMVTAQHLPQSDMFVVDTSHGKRSCFLDLDKPDEADRLLALVRGADVFSQGYRPGVMARRGLSPERLAALRPGIVYTSMNCYGFGGPFGERAGWEQLAQTVTGIADEHGRDRPTLLPAAACDYLTGYLAAYGTLLALGLRARVGGSYHVQASLCQSGMLLQRQRRMDDVPMDIDIPQALIGQISLETDTANGHLRHLGPVLGMAETKPRWELPSPRLGSHTADWT
ncbi:MAG: CoA transferase [Pseudomonadota bacterium]